MTMLNTERKSIFEQVKRGLNILGYKDNLIRENYEFTDVYSPELLVKTIPLATFYQDPPSYYNACFGVVVSNGQCGDELVSNYRSLGAPQIFEIRPEAVYRWKNSIHNTPQCLGKIETNQIQKLFEEHKEDWSPNRIKVAKSILPSNLSYQYDFFDLDLLPLLDKEVQTKFNRLLTNIINHVATQYPRLEDESAQLFRLIFRLIAAKVFSDRKHEGNWLQNNPALVVKEVEKYYFRRRTPEPVLEDVEIQNYVWDVIRKSFHFQNLSVETLAYIWETSLMTPELRRKTSTHGTPSTIAEYIVRRLPIETIGINERTVFEPFSGHAIFLVAALRRLRELLPVELNYSDRHEYFVNMLSGLEREDFSREIARLLLMLADYPNPDSWNLLKGDVFIDINLDKEIARANVILCNPPFENFTDSERLAYSNLLSPYKPVEILNRILNNPPKFLGFILPRVFITGKGYKSIRNLLSKTYSTIEVLAMPDNVFKYSSADTVILIAYGKKTGKIHLITGQVLKKDLNTFYSNYQPSYIKYRDIIADPKIFEKSIWLPELNEIWDYLSSYEKLNKYIEIHRGFEYNFTLDGNEDKIVSATPKPNYLKGLRLVKESLEPYILRNVSYINANLKDMRRGAYILNWDKPKIIVNASRTSVGHWRLIAAEDYEGLRCTQYFHVIWPLSNDIPLEVITALLNSPVINAFISDHMISARENNINLIKQSPVPNFTGEQVNQIVRLVNDYKHCRNNRANDTDTQNEYLRLMKLIDGKVLEAYNLPKEYNRKILEYFNDYKRPVPFSFTGYYSETYNQQITKLKNRISKLEILKKGNVEERNKHDLETLEYFNDYRKRANALLEDEV